MAAAVEQMRLGASAEAAPEAAIERISRIAQRPVRVEDYVWPMGAPGEDEMQARLEREAGALALLERMGRYGVTGREKVIYYFAVLHYILETQRGLLDKPITWEDFKRLFAHELVQYSKGRSCHD